MIQRVSKQSLRHRLIIPFPSKGGWFASLTAGGPIQGCGWHYSHLYHQNIYGHQWVTIMLQCDDLVLSYQIIPYEKDKRTKIEIVKDILIDLPHPPYKGYVLAGSWYTCRRLIQLSQQIGFYYLGGIKTNRIIFPKGYRPKGI